MYVTAVWVLAVGQLLIRFISRRFLYPEYGDDRLLRNVGSYKAYRRHVSEEVPSTLPKFTDSADVTQITINDNYLYVDTPTTSVWQYDHGSSYGRISEYQLF
jgi:hypothetical protein